MLFEECIDSFPAQKNVGFFSVLCTITTEGTLFMLQKHDLYWQQSPGISNFLQVWTMEEFYDKRVTVNFLLAIGSSFTER